VKLFIVSVLGGLLPLLLFALSVRILEKELRPFLCKRPEFPSGITLGMQPTIQSWFSQRVGERRVAHGDGDR
jgi:hypothetical protein